VGDSGGLERRRSGLPEGPGGDSFAALTRARGHRRRPTTGHGQRRLSVGSLVRPFAEVGFVSCGTMGASVRGEFGGECRSSVATLKLGASLSIGRVRRFSRDRGWRFAGLLPAGQRRPTASAAGSPTGLFGVSANPPRFDGVRLV